MRTALIEFGLLFSIVATLTVCLLIIVYVEKNLGGVVAAAVVIASAVVAIWSIFQVLP